MLAFGVICLLDHHDQTIQATTEMRSCSAVRSLEAEDAAKALAAAEETCKAAKIRTAAVTESQAAGAKSHESELLRMIDSLKADVGSLSQEVVDAKREKIQEAIRSRDLQRSLDEERRHFSEVMAKQNTAPVADLAKLEDQVNDIEQQRRKLVSRIALEKKESSTSEKLKKDTHTAEQIEQQVDELTVRANDTLKQVKEQHAVRMAATQEVIKSAHEVQYVYLPIGVLSKGHVQVGSCRSALNSIDKTRGASTSCGCTSFGRNFSCVWCALGTDSHCAPHSRFFMCYYKFQFPYTQSRAQP